MESLAGAFHFKLGYERAEKPYLHPGVSAKLLLGKKEVGYIGELDPAIALSLGLDKKVYLGELDWEALKGAAEDGVTFVNLPKFPAVKRDLALIADEKLTCAEVEEVLLHSCKYVTEAGFSTYTGAGRCPKARRAWRSL